MKFVMITLFLALCSSSMAIPHPMEGQPSGASPAIPQNDAKSGLASNVARPEIQPKVAAQQGDPAGVQVQLPKSQLPGATVDQTAGTNPNAKAPQLPQDKRINQINTSPPTSGVTPNVQPNIANTAPKAQVKPGTQTTTNEQAANNNNIKTEELKSQLVAGGNTQGVIRNAGVQQPLAKQEAKLATDLKGVKTDNPSEVETLKQRIAKLNQQLLEANVKIQELTRKQPGLQSPANTRQ